jgi:hypothetical protein
MGASDPLLATAATDELVADSLTALGTPERVNYATGVLLGAEDFAAEQLYLRGRLARALAALNGHGTLAGLRVACPLADNPQLEIFVAPGLAQDRLGRLVEVRRTQCLHLRPWLVAQQALDPTDPQRVALQAGVREDLPGQRRLVLDVFIRYLQCPHGRTPAFAAGPFDATDYIVPARWADGFELTLQLAHSVPVDPTASSGADLTRLALPQPRSPALEAMRVALGAITDPESLAAATRAWAVANVLDAWPQPAFDDAGRMPRLSEHASDADWDRVLLGRISLPVIQSSPVDFPAVDDAALNAALAASAAADLADNSLRPVVFNPLAWRGALAWA